MATSSFITAGLCVHTDRGAIAALQDFVERRGARPFFATLWLHTIHLPRGALPQWFHNYTDSFGDPAGDYLGSL